MSQKKKFQLSTKVNLDNKLDEEDSFRPSTTAAATGFDFNFELPNQKVKPNSMHSIRNIFDDVNNEERKKYKDSQIGPRYEDEKKEKIVKWSIVGRPEQFLSVRNRNKQRVQIKQKRPDQDDSYSDDVPSAKPIMLQASQSQMSGMGSQRKTPKKPRGEFKVIQRQDVLVKMVEVKRRIELDKIERHKSEQKFPLHLRNAITRERRILETHDGLAERWEFLNNQIASNCERNPKQTILMRSDNFRERQQKINIIESQKNEDEKYNDRLWYMRLRWYDHKDNRPPFTLITSQAQKSAPMSSRLVNRYIKDYEAEHLNQQQNFVLSDIQSNFNTKVIDNPYGQVEQVIPSGNIHKHIIVHQHRLYSEKMNELLDEKIKERPKKKYVELQEFLEVTGENMFKKELEYIRSDKQQEYQYFEEKPDEQEVYVDNWNVHHLSKMGLPLFQHL